MTLYLDASAVAALVLEEPSASAVRENVEGYRGPVLFSDFGAAEVCSAVYLRLRMPQGTLAAAEFQLSVFDELRGSAWTELEVTRSDVRAAEALVRRFHLKLRAPDAIHAAVCLRLGAKLLTRHKRLAEAAAALRIEVVAITVGEA